jgi:hypothetical protein
VEPNFQVYLDFKSIDSIVGLALTCTYIVIIDNIPFLVLNSDISVSSGKWNVIFLHDNSKAFDNNLKKYKT